MKRYQYFGPPYTIDGDNGRVLNLLPGSLIQLSEEEAKTVLSYDGLRLVPVPKPVQKNTLSAVLEVTPTRTDDEGENENAGIFLGEGESKESEPSESKVESDTKKKRRSKRTKKKKREPKEDAPDTNNEG